jgi:hypothetical protein
MKSMNAKMLSELSHISIEELNNRLDARLASMTVIQDTYGAEYASAFSDALDWVLSLTRAN